jgi:tight adherence protein C
MIWFVVGLIALSVALFVFAAAQMVTPAEARLVRRRLQTSAGVDVGIREIRERRRRRQTRESLESFLEAFGARFGAESGQRKNLRSMLIHAGYRRPNAGLIFTGTRIFLAGIFFVVGVLAATFFGVSPQNRMFMVLGGLLLGWMIPFIVLRRKVRIRQEELQRSLPDALDMMVVCVEAGMGLNQALVRVGEEMDRVSPALAEEFTLVSLEIRAGTPRDEALRHLGERTGLADIRAFVSMLIQTDRFGTAIGSALRIHADESRTVRRQRAEEAAAKLAVKLLIPIVFLIFPSMFIVILGPAVFRMADLFGAVGSGP